MECRWTSYVPCGHGKRFHFRKFTFVTKNGALFLQRFGKRDGLAMKIQYEVLHYQ